MKTRVVIMLLLLVPGCGTGTEGLGSVDRTEPQEVAATSPVKCVDGLSETGAWTCTTATDLPPCGIGPHYPCAGGRLHGGRGVCGTLETDLLDARYQAYDIRRRGGSEQQIEEADRAVAVIEAEMKQLGMDCETDTAVLLEKYA